MVTQLQPTRSGIGSHWLQRIWQNVAAWRPLSVIPTPPTEASPLKPLCTVVVEGNDEQAQLVQRFLDLGRSALLLRPAIAHTISTPHLAMVHQVLAQEMAWSAAGDVLLTCGLIDGDQTSGTPTHCEHVDTFYLDRFAVTNRRYHEFVAQGGYSHEAVWDESIWPRVSEFVDRTGAPGPRYWSHGQFASGTEEYPVVGVSWFEADAFARWAGKRLPTDAEWVKVAACPALSTGSLVQRRFPWGDVWDPARGNVWIAGLGRPVPVDQYQNGNSASGVTQLVGNVWEWTSSNMRAAAFGEEIQFDSPLKSIRGGAFDTYFENQATCQLQSGDIPVARRHNVGFRCALSAADIVGLEQKS